MIHNEGNAPDIGKIPKSIDEEVADDVIMRCVDHDRKAVDSTSFVSREELPKHLETFVEGCVDEKGVSRRAKPSTLWIPQVALAPDVPGA